MAAITPEVENEKLFGMAKRIDKELNELPTLEHATMITMLNAVLQKRIQAEQRTKIEEQQQAKREAEFGIRAPGLAVVPS